MAITLQAGNVEVTIPWNIWNLLLAEHRDEITGCGGTMQEFWSDKIHDIHHVVLRVREPFVRDLLTWCSQIEHRISASAARTVTDADLEG